MSAVIYSVLLISQGEKSVCQNFAGEAEIEIRTVGLTNSDERRINGFVFSPAFI